MIGTEDIVELQHRVAISDDARAYRQLFFIFYKPLVRFALGFVDNEDQAEDVVSDVFLKLWTNRAKLKTIGCLKVYLYVAAKNTALNYVAKNRKMKTVSLDDLDIKLPATILNPEQLMITADMVKRIDAAISSLPPKCKLIFKLIREDGLPYKDVADILNVSIKTLDSQLAIALKKIASAINLPLHRKIKY